MSFVYNPSIKSHSPIMEGVSSHSKPASLLTLPYEIRRQIYELVLYREKPISSAVRTFLPTIPNVRLLAVASLSDPTRVQSFTRCLDFYSIPPMLSSIRAVNSQLYYETREFVHFPKYRVRITIDDELDGKKFEKVLQVLNYDFVKRNTIEVWFQFAGDRVFGKYQAPLKEGYKQWFRSLFVPWRNIMESFQTILFRKPAKESPLKKMVEILHNYPQLAVLNLRTYERDIFEVWKDPVRDLPSFAPLLEREVKINIEIGTRNLNFWFSSRGRLLQSMTEGNGEVVLVKQGIKPWFGAPRGAQLFGAQLRTLV